MTDAEKINILSDALMQIIFKCIASRKSMFNEEVYKCAQTALVQVKNNYLNFLGN